MLQSADTVRPPRPQKRHAPIGGCSTRQGRVLRRVQQGSVLLVHDRSDTAARREIARNAPPRVKPRPQRPSHIAQTQKNPIQRGLRIGIFASRNHQLLLLVRHRTLVDTLKISLAAAAFFDFVQLLTHIKLLLFWFDCKTQCIKYIITYAKYQTSFARKECFFAKSSRFQSISSIYWNVISWQSGRFSCPKSG